MPIRLRKARLKAVASEYPRLRAMVWTEALETAKVFLAESILRTVRISTIDVNLANLRVRAGLEKPQSSAALSTSNSLSPMCLDWFAFV